MRNSHTWKQENESYLLSGCYVVWGIQETVILSKIISGLQMYRIAQKFCQALLKSNENNIRTIP